MPNASTLLVVAVALSIATARSVHAQSPVQTPQPPQAQEPAGPTPLFCGQVVPPPTKLPPAGTGPLVTIVGPCFDKQGGASVIDPQTYLFYIQLRGSQPSKDIWVPYDEAAERTMLEDFKRLWATNFLDDLSIEVTDYLYPNGVLGKLVSYNMEERQRVRIVSYTGSKKLEQTKIDDKLKELGIGIRTDSFLDPGLIRRVEGVIRDLLAEKGYQFSTVSHALQEIAGGPKLVNLTFSINDGPKVKIRTVDFVGNRAVSDGTLKRKMKENKETWFLSFITSRGTYRSDKFEEDAEKVVGFYRDKGYIGARVGQPDLKYLTEDKEGKTRWIELRIPVDEGERYKVGNFGFDGNTIVKSEHLRPLFKTKEGQYYNEKSIRKGFEKAREIYGTGGYWEMTGYPDLEPRDPDKVAQRAGNGVSPAPIVDVTLRIQEGKQYFINRIEFSGNTTTRANVIRRELRIFEGGVFNTEGLKYSVRRLNQLGYFKPLEGEAIKVEKTPNVDNKVDVGLKLEEQNRNQLTFGAGVSQFEGVFGQLAFQTSNFLGRGETLSVQLQKGARATNYQLGFTEPFLFDKPITGGIDFFKREIRYISLYTRAETGGDLVFGFPLGRGYTRMFATYGYSKSRVKELNPLFEDPEVLRRNPFLADALLLGQGGTRTISKIVPSLVYNSVDHPIFPTTGRRMTASADVAGIGGNTNFFKPRLEGIWYLQHTRRTSLGFRGQFEYVTAFAGTEVLPIFERLFLGGEYSVRGFDIQTISPRDPESGLEIGGNKSLLFNAEYLITIAGPVRLVLFYDAGQVQNTGSKFARDAFRTSTGAEIRFFMPVLNVPFRLIFAANPQRDGVFDRQGSPQKLYVFRFAVGTTF